MIVDDQAGRGFAGEAAEQAALFEHFSAVHLLFPVLENFYACPEKGGGNFLKRAAEGETAVRKGINIGIRTGTGKNTGAAHGVHI